MIITVSITGGPVELQPIFQRIQRKMGLSKRCHNKSQSHTEGALKISGILDDLTYTGHHDYFSFSMDMLTRNPNFMVMDQMCQTGMKNEAFWGGLSIYPTNEMREELQAGMSRGLSLYAFSGVFLLSDDRLCETHTHSHRLTGIH